MSTCRWVLGLGAVAVMLLALPSGATVRTGAIVGMHAGTGRSWGGYTRGLEWGDGIHDLHCVWSIRNPEESGYVYGTGDPTWGRADSNVDVYVYSGLTDPTIVHDATVFEYTYETAIIREGDTVFFRGRNGYYGAWRIDAIYPDPNPAYEADLDGQWYFQDNGTGEFSGGTVTQTGVPPIHPNQVPSSWGAIKGLYR